jgi:RND family efflux transporter MFP subunit
MTFQLRNPVVWVATCTLAITCLASSVDAQMHEGRITRSFTEPIEKSVAASAESGIVAIAHVREGDRVRVGDPLAAINHNVLKESLAIAEANAAATARFDAATAQLDLIKSQLEAITGLVKDGHTNPYEVQQKTAEHHQAVAEVRAAKDELKLAELEVGRIKAQIQDRIIKSPIDGFVTEIHKQLGENVSNNEPQYATIVRVDKLKVRFYLDAATLRKSQVGDTVSIRIGPQKSRSSATISFISPVIDPDSGLGRMDVVIENKDLSIQSGIDCYWQEQQQSVADRSIQIK